MTWPPSASAPTLVEILRQRAARQGGKIAYRFLADGEDEVASLTFAELDRRARAVGAFLQESGAAGERALLLYPPGLEFVVSFLGCLYGGVIAVPAYPPRANRPDARLAAIVKDARPRFALTAPGLAELAPSFAAQVPGLREVRWVATEEIDAEWAERWTPEADPAAAAGRTAFLQYTSGSTSTPKGVMVTHGNLVHNERMIQLAFGQSEDSVIAGWLPLYHDMGLIGNVLQPLFTGASCVLMAPVAFLQQPVRWLRAISRYRATTSGGPNFAYELCARKIEPSALAGLDLSSWQVAFNGAEPVRAETLRRFSEVFAPYGFRSEAFYPCYGLAEATLFVTGGTPGRQTPIHEVDAEALGRNQALPAAPGRPSRALVACGGAWLEQDLRIVDPESGETLPEGRVGEVQVGGESVAAGYWERPEQTLETFGSGFLRTGDLGFLAGGELYVTGRVKDLVIIRGRNHYPQDIELTAEQSHPALRQGGGAAFSVDVDGEERLVIVHEVERIWRRDLDGVIAAVRRAVAEEHEVPVHAVTLIKPNTLPKTSSGKVRRRSCREDFLAGRLDPLDAWQAGEARPGEAAEPAIAGVAPRTPTEERLALIWCEVFEVAAAGVEDGFFEMGGDSLKATQMVSRINEAFGVDLPLDSLFSSPTIAGLAALLDGMAAPAVPEAPPLRPHEGREAGAPLSFAQRRLWFLHQLDPENPVHNIAAFLRLTGALDLPALRRSLDAIVERHEALRTVFRGVSHGDGHEPAQVVEPPSPLPLPVIDLAALPPVHRETAEEGIAALVARLPFALEHGPFVRAVLTRSGAAAHGLVLSWHHIAADGWSLGVFVRELTALYQGAPLPALPVQYADFALWQRQWLRGEALEARLAYWRQTLQGTPPVLELPTDRPRPSVLSHRGAHHEQLLPESVIRPLTALAREAAATPFMALLTGFAALLHRSTGQQDLVLGTPISGRNRRELEDLIGVFINNLVLRIDLGGAGGVPSFRQLLQRVRQTALAAYAHQDLPFETLVDAQQIERDLSRTPLFQILFVEQSAPLRRRELAGLTLEPREIDLGTARFDLALAMAPVEAGFLGTWKYSTDLFDAPAPARMAGQLENLLAAAVADPDLPLSRLTWLSEAERHQVVLGWNDTRVGYRQDVCLHELIEEQVERTPGAVAVSFDGLETTYRELNRRANRLAHHLRRLGVGPECLVGVAAERSTEMVTGLVATLKAGGAYVPLDPGYPRDRVQFMLEDAGIGVLLTQSHLEAGLPPHSARVVLLDVESSWEPARVSNPEVGTHPDNPAYAIYTSGSTGRPKGAMIPHRGIVNRLLWMQERYGLGADDRVLQKTPFSFDVSVWELFWPLITGARLVMAPPGAHQDAAWLARLIHDEKITTLHFVPSMLQLFLEAKDLATACRSVRRVMASGEALPYDLQERALERIGAELHNLYGPTEASVDVSFHACEPGSARRTVPIGRPISNITLPILDRHGEPVPPGIPGELLIGGVGLARGYLHRPALTAERFVPDPLGGPGERLYRTGDLARFRPDGAIEFLGRIDHQIKIRGVRVELGEIEAVLDSHPGVREAVVMARHEGPVGVGETRLVAYVVAAAEAPPSQAELRSFLRDSLPEAMVPAAFVVLPAFPLTPSGKVDRRSLPAPDFESAGRESTPFAEPRTPLEERLAALWRELLRVERLGIHDSFFELGGDSIQGAMFINRLQEELGQIVYVMALFDAPTVAGFAAYLERSYPEAAVRLGGRAAGAQTGEAGEAGPVETAAALDTLHAAVVRRLGRTAEAPAAVPQDLPKNPRAVFVLAPFRSGTTLFRVMLAGHPRLFAPPELELLAFRTLGERQRAYAGRNSFALEGLLRAVMELRGGDADEARAWVAGFEERDLPVQSFYGLLQQESGGRVLVDKTPSYPLDLETLRRAEEMFEEPLYLHLVRHPRATADSYVEAHMDRVYDFPFPPDEQAELVWLLSHRNIVEFLSGVPAERVHRLRFEDLVKAPGESIAAVCAFLGLPFEPAMLEPYQGGRMTDGLHSESRMMGDPKFHRHQGIEARVADRWQEARGGLRPETVELAALLGYAMAPREEAKPAPETLGPRPVPRDVGNEMALSYSQERLWFLAQLDPGSPAYNMPATVHLDGILDVPSLARSFDEVRRRHEVLRTTFPSAGDRPALRVGEAVGALPGVDLSGLPEAEGRREMERLALEEGRRPFDLERGPMLRTTLLRLGSAEHALLVTMHHIVSDGWTIGILIRELAALYTAFSQGQPSPLPELPIQYADYAVWQRQWLDGSAMAAHLDYWRLRLAGRLPALEMPTDRPRPAFQTFRGARLSRTLSPEASQELRDWSRRQGTTPFLTLLAGFNALLHRYTAQDDLLLGIPIANRNRLEVENLIGFFLNMVVQRTDVSGDPTLRELLGRVSEGFLGSVPHQVVPFEKLVEALQPERDLSRAPIFQVQFSLQNTPTAPLALPGLELELLDFTNRTTKFDFTVFLFDLPDGLKTTLEYNTDLFDAVTIARLLGHWERLLAGVPAHAERRVSELPLLTEAERGQLLGAWSGPAAQPGTFPAAACLHRRFEEQAWRDPKAAAVVYEVQELSYGRLNERANRLARRLRALGVGPDVPVALCVERSLDMIVGLLGILKAGGAYVPLDPAYPPDRLTYVLEDALAGSPAPVLVTQERLAGLFGAELPFPVVRLDADRALLNAESGEDLEDEETAGPWPESLAYVIYTSGSTGRPKGVPVTHANAVRLLEATDFWFGFGPDDVWTMFHSFAFDFSVWEIWGALAYGGRLVIVPREVTLSPASFHELLATEGVTVLNQTPSAFRQLVQLDQAEAHRRLDLRWVIFGGEALELSALAPWFARHGDETPRLVNMYGITETTVHVTYRPIVQGDLKAPGNAPIGAPIPDLSLHLLGPRGELVPVGIPGEIHVGGAGVARGYLGRPALTAERFVPDPFGGEPGARLYRSGDLARRRPDGDLEYLGRIDHQVKIRGFRIELGEIESALARHPGVREAVVMARNVSGGTGADRRLVAWVVPREAPVPAAELREHLQGTLPEYMVPSVFVDLAKLPLTANGKVDRRALPDPEEAAAARAVVAPRNRTEARLAAIWRELLRRDEVGVEDNFFELGGHSLLVTQLASRIRTVFGVELPVRVIFEAPSLAGLAARLAGALPEEESAGEPPLPRLPRDGGEEGFPLSFAQERLWFLDQLNPGSATYNIWVALRLEGSLDVPVLHAALDEIVRRHESLRTRFVQVGGEPRQVIDPGPAAGPATSLPLPVIDLRGLPEEAREAEAPRWLKAAAQRPFDLARGPLLRMLLVRLGATEWRAIFELHHIVSDGWSNDVLVREAGVLYEAFAAGRPSPLPELPIQYADFAAWQRESLHHEAVAGQLAYWRERLAGAPPLLELPTDRPRPTVQRGHGGDLRRVFAAERVREVTNFCRAEGATLFMGLAAGLAMLLARYTGRTDILVGTPVSGRNRLEVEGLIGIFINSLVLRTDLGGDPGFREVVGRTRDVALGAFAHQDLPYEKLVEELAPERSLGHAPIFQVMLALQNPQGGVLSLPGLDLTSLPLEEATTKLDLLLNAQEMDGHLQVRWIYDRDLFDAPTIARLSEHLERLLHAAVSEPERRISELPLLTPAEERQLVAWNATATDYPVEPCLHDLIAAQTVRTPDRVALTCEGESLSYGALAAAAGRLARRLAALGVGPDVPVGIFAERSLEMMTALHAVLQAGAAYVPVDPDYPADRIAYMIEDSGAPVLLVQAHLADRLPPHQARVILLDGRADEMDEAMPLVAIPDNLAYVIYTSGSTGRPKGTMNSHRGIVNRLLWMQEEYGLTGDDRVLQKTPVSFDVSVWELFWPLLTGACLAVARPGGHQDPAYLVETIVRDEITTLHFVPSMLQVFLDEKGVERCVTPRRVICSGEALPADLVRRFHARLRTGLHNLYGPTEAAVDVTYRECPWEPERSSVPIGRPVANTQIWLLDRALSTVPLGAGGELHIGGVQLARGYLGRPDLTAEKFIPDPFAAERGQPGARLYRTGDLARHLPSGEVDFLGRIDHQVKIRGFRIETEEIGAVLALHPAVREAVVVARKSSLGDLRLAAYAVPADASAAPGELIPELRAFLGGRLPSYMVPADFVLLPAFPLGPSGKVDRKALPAPEAVEAPERRYAPPETPTEELLVTIWEQVLDRQRIGIHDNFFELGGHSLLAPRVLSRIEETFQVHLTLRAFFEAPTIHGLADQVELILLQEIEALSDEEAELQMAGAS